MAGDFPRTENRVLNCEIGGVASTNSVTTQTPIEPRRPVTPPIPEQAPKIHRVEVYWQAVTYKTVAVYLVLLFVIIIAAMYVAIPDWTRVVTKKLTAIGNTDTDNLTISQTQAKFVNLDGRVQVKKVNSVTWVDADYHTALDKGDLIQTGSDGAARMTFADGTEYTVKAESMVTVEENNVTTRAVQHRGAHQYRSSGPGHAEVVFAKFEGGGKRGRRHGDGGTEQPPQ